MLRSPSNRKALFDHLEGARHALSGNRPDLISWRIGDRERSQRERLLAHFSVLPGLDDPRLLIPLDTTSAGLRAILNQQARSVTGTAAQLAARLLAIAAALGVAVPAMRQRLLVEAVDATLVRTPLHAFFADLLGRYDVSLTFRLAPGRPNSKPVVQITDYGGSILAYAKFGWDPVSRHLVRREARLLSILSARVGRSLIAVPRIIGAGPWQGLETLIVSPLSATGRIPKSVTDIPAAAVRCLSEVGRNRQSKLDDSPFWYRTKARVEISSTLLPANYGEILGGAIRMIERCCGDWSISFGFQHGDWIPPNINVRADGGLNVWDWEHGTFDAPRGIDTVQFVLFQIFRGREAKSAIVRQLQSDSSAALEKQDVPASHALLLACLSLIGSILWFGEAYRVGRQPEIDPRYADALRAVLEVIRQN